MIARTSYRNINPWQMIWDTTQFIYGGNFYIMTIKIRDLSLFLLPCVRFARKHSDSCSFIMRIINTTKRANNFFKHKAKTFLNNCFCYAKILLNTGPGLCFIKVSVIFRHFVHFWTKAICTHNTHHITIREAISNSNTSTRFNNPNSFPYLFIFHLFSLYYLSVVFS